MAADWWSGIELRHLVALDAVAREGSFRRAAERLGYVQSAISHQIAALESLVGKRLIDRSRGTRPLALTPAGELLLSHADAVITRMRAAQADLLALDGNGEAALRVGATSDLLSRIVPALLRACGVPVALHEVPSARALTALLVRSELDLALTEVPPSGGSLDSAPLADEPFVALVQRGSQTGPALGGRDLDGVPLIAHAPTREQVGEQLQAQGIAPRFVLEVETGAAAQRLVASGLGAAILPRLAVDDRRAETSLVPLAPGLIRPRRIGAVWSRARALRAEGSAFVEAARSLGVCQS
jgi:DNA-binding transcriptional LysR family regulator